MAERNHRPGNVAWRESLRRIVFADAVSMGIWQNQGKKIKEYKLKRELKNEDHPPLISISESN